LNLFNRKSTLTPEKYFNFSMISRYFQRTPDNNAYYTITDRTWNDLDMNQLFCYLDKTTSGIGQQYFYYRLRKIPLTISDLELDENFISALSQDEALQNKLKRQLLKLSDQSSYYIVDLFQETPISAPRWFSLLILLPVIVVLSLVLLPYNPGMLFVLLPVVIVNIGLHFWNKRNLYRYTDGIRKLLIMNGVAKKMAQIELIKPIDPAITKSTKQLDKLRNKMSIFRFDASLQSELETLFWAILELFKILFLLEPILLFSVLKSLTIEKQSIENVFNYVGKVDYLLSMAALRNTNISYCIPTLNNHSEVRFQGIYHPLINNCENNDINIQHESVLLTGSNMSGKTTFIRTIGINFITGLTINTCFAQSADIYVAKIYSAIRITDDLTNDKSYFFEEVQVIKEIIDQSTLGYPSLFLLDELFKGTNTIERIAAGKAVLSSIAIPRNKVFVSTHDIELVDMLTEHYKLYHFTEQIVDGKVKFDYKLKEGKLKFTNAIRILELSNYPKDIIDEAKTISNNLQCNNIAILN